MFKVSMVELIPLFFLLLVWVSGLSAFFYFAWRLVKAVEKIAENTSPKRE